MKSIDVILKLRKDIDLNVNLSMQRIRLLNNLIIEF